ncbi:MAG: helix-turn-helix transcriptional regulator [Dehalococcoidia bacterium]
MVDERGARWTFLTNYGHVLLFIAKHPDARLRDVAEAVGITERAAQRIVYDLVEEGYLDREREGRRNRYTVQLDRPLRHPLESEHTIEELMTTLGAEPRH